MPFSPASRNVLLLIGVVAFSAFIGAGRRQEPMPENHLSQATPANPPPSGGIPSEGQYVLITKAERRLRLYRQGVLIRDCRIDLGANPTADKCVEGDGCTPVGTFFVCTQNRRSRYYLSLGLSYPNREDAARGLRDGLITRAEHDAILSAIEQRRCPPWHTALGGAICIHGRGGTGRDWTLGCVAVADADMDLIFNHAVPGTPVEIRR